MSVVMPGRAGIPSPSPFWVTICLSLPCAAIAPPGFAQSPADFPEYRSPVMTWVAPYAVEKSFSRLRESFGGLGMKDGLTHLGLQFWLPTAAGGLIRAGKTNETSDAAVTALRDWGHEHGVRVLLCVFNAVEGWDWSLARAGFAEHPETFTSALLAEVERLGLDGVDLDLEGTGSHEEDKAAYVSFVRGLSERLHQRGWHLTLDTFSYQWHAPNQNWWAELLPHVDALTTMGYEEIGANSQGWRGYAAQKTVAGPYARRLLIGLPAGREEWEHDHLRIHLAWLRSDREVGVAFWDAQLRSSAWRAPETWKVLQSIRGRPGD